MVGYFSDNGAIGDSTSGAKYTIEPGTSNELWIKNSATNSGGIALYTNGNKRLTISYNGAISLNGTTTVKNDVPLKVGYIWAGNEAAVLTRKESGINVNYWPLTVDHAHMHFHNGYHMDFYDDSSTINNGQTLHIDKLGISTHDYKTLTFAQGSSSLSATGSPSSALSYIQLGRNLDNSDSGAGIHYASTLCHKFRVNGNNTLTIDGAGVVTPYLKLSHNAAASTTAGF
jgi:hypothetical protein